ncbi:hypothetical protein DFH29DRAFT_1052229 [Suillus ampliporus]|nr:hypothetical protein DFH29DRAFT_1052229 [Suillus ampliporus]
MQRASLWSSMFLLLALIFLSMPEIVPPTQVARQDFSRPCDKHGHFLPEVTAPLPPEPNLKSQNDWTPFRNRMEFETAKYFYIHNQIPAGQADHLLNLWATTLLKSGGSPPFADHKDLYATIDSIALGDVKWEGFMCTYTGEKPNGHPPWMDGTYDVWYRDPQEVVRNMLVNPSYSNEMDYLYERQLWDFMLADWAWNQVDIIAGDPETLGSTFMPIILGSDKTTVSVTTGNNKYYPLYLSIGNVHNNVRCAHRDALMVIGFLAMPKTTKKHADDPKFRKFCCQLFHSSLSRILTSLRPGMSTPEVTKFGDSHFQCVIYGLGPYITDYEEQVLLACIVCFWCPRCCSHRDSLNTPSLLRCREYHEALFEAGTYGELWVEFGIVADLIPFTNDFPHTNIHETMAPDILHQVIKGTFKDHLLTHGRTGADHILDDIDHRIAAVASFSGLCRFPQGWGFKQWTGDDSKALMKHTLDEIQDAVSHFHQYCKIFKTSGIIPTFSLPWQHSLMHYAHVIQLFGTPNGLCSSITESKHIKAVKEPWRQSSKYKVLSQMLVTNQHLSKLAAAHVDFDSCGMLKGTCLSAELEALSTSENVDVSNDKGPNVPPPNEANDRSTTALCAETKCAHDVLALTEKLHLPSLPALIHCFLYEQTCPNDTQDIYEISLAACPRYEGKISVFNSTCSRFYAPSDLCRIGGMRVEHIRSCPLWWNKFSCYDWLEIARVRVFFSFNYAGTAYPCAVVRWFDVTGDSPDPEMGMWMYHTCGHHLSCCSPIPIYGHHFVPLIITLHVSYDAFWAYYVNKYVDHHAFEIAS